MTVEIGSRYAETVAGLRERIRDGDIGLAGFPQGPHTCYLCNKRIRGLVYILKDGDTKFFVDSDCYMDARISEAL